MMLHPAILLWAAPGSKNHVSVKLTSRPETNAMLAARAALRRQDPVSGRDRKFERMTCGCFDLHKQIVTADVGFQKHHACRRAETFAQYPVNGRHIGVMSHIDLVAQVGQRKTGLRRHTIGFGNHLADIRNRFPGLRRDVADVQCLVPHDAGCAGQEQHVTPTDMRDIGAGKRRTARAILLRILVGADLAWILDRHRRRTARSKKINRQRAFGKTDRRGGRYAADNIAPASDEAVLPAHVELPVALHVVAVAIDIGDVIPEAQDVREFQCIEQSEYFAIRMVGGTLQRWTVCIVIVRRKLRFRYLDGAKQDVVVVSILQCITRDAGKVAVSRPDFTRGCGGAGDIERGHRHLCERRTRR